ncbi:MULTISPECIES: DUF1772 domain-containing protein [unclassified Mycobacterium]|uniref:anthrone oxygenase family protein n=1 Tax=unclassified Mycobacterium TaxID=2642494 RepID=UPI0029C8AD6C|nr:MULTISPECIES: anthrone oxygenase family protein [unclassified Mycobacterium]
MSTSPYVIAAGAATISTAAVGGMFYIFSTMVMKGLDRTEPVEALTAMRGINAQANASAPFLIFFMGSTVLAAVVGVIAALRWSTPGSGYLLAGAVLSVLAFVVTMAFNVPLNNHLDGLDPSALSAADALSEWKAYLVPWTNWNHVRTVTPLVGSALMLIGLRSLG